MAISSAIPFYLGQAATWRDNNEIGHIFIKTVFTNLLALTPAFS
jgi:hypothetical protein